MYLFTFSSTIEKMNICVVTPQFSHSYVLLPERPLELVVVDEGAAVVRDPQLEPVRRPGQLRHAPLPPAL